MKNPQPTQKAKKEPKWTIFSLYLHLTEASWNPDQTRHAEEGKEKLFTTSRLMFKRKNYFLQG